MDKMNLLMVLHSHQPVGNFDHVFAYAVERCYRPVLRVLAQYPAFRLGLHYSGPLLSWLEEHDQALLQEIAALCARGQVEMLTGGYYEPLLASIPGRDALGQMAMLTEYTQRRFGQRAKGFWLAERIWEPSLPVKLAPSGLAYTIVDDTHFYYAGLDPSAMFGYHLTEREGHPLALFPTHKALRYSIPFKEPQETIDFLQRTLDEQGPCAATYGDDSEKFGLWPGTHEWVIQKGWLQRFIEAVLAQSDWLEPLPPGEYLEANPPRGQVYPPTASYEEMLTWALPAEASLKMERLIKQLQQEGRLDQMRQFLRGGLWDNFLVKYRESNLMHKRMLAVSRKVAQSPDDQARDHLYQAQCNCAYWHGLFGGLYLGHLRHAVHQHLIAAEDLIDQAERGQGPWAHSLSQDLDLDGHPEAALSSPELDLWVHAGYGGSVSVLDYRPARFNLGNTLTRRLEAYHALFKEKQEQAQPEGEVKSIHDEVIIKDEGLEKLLAYDWYQRASFQDHLLPPDQALEPYTQAAHTEWGDLVGQPYELLEHGHQGAEAWCLLKRAGHLWTPDGPWPLSLQKRLTLSAGGRLTCRYQLQVAPQAPEFVLAVELNLTLLSETSPNRRLELSDGSGLSLDQAHQVPSTPGFRLVNADDNFTVNLSASPAAGLWCFPVQTVSHSESGLERTYQGSSFTWLFPAPAGRGELELELSLEIVPGVPPA